MFHDMSGFGMGFGWIFIFLFWAFVILGIIAIVKWLAGMTSKTGTPPSRTARQIIEERYARGEIDREEFEQKKQDIER